MRRIRAFSRTPPRPYCRREPSAGQRILQRPRSTVVLHAPRKAARRRAPPDAPVASRRSPERRTRTVAPASALPPNSPGLDHVDDWGSVGPGQFALGRTPPHCVAAHGGLEIVPALRHGVSEPCAACPGPGIEKLRIRFDDPGRVHRSGARGTGAINNPSRRPEDRGNSRTLAIRRETEDDSFSGFAAGTQAGGSSGRRTRPSWGVESDDCINGLIHAARARLRPGSTASLLEVRPILRYRGRRAPH